MSPSDSPDHPGSMLYHSKSSEVLYSTKPVTGQELFCCFLQQNGSRTQLASSDKKKRALSGQEKSVYKAISAVKMSYSLLVWRIHIGKVLNFVHLGSEQKYNGQLKNSFYVISKYFFSLQYFRE